jgi:hypothetical protein
MEFKMMDAKTPKQIAALQCAVRVMEGIAGGYTKQQIQDSRLALMELILEMEGTQ